ncbi:MAG: glycosyltransferase family 4 protein [Candidatus Obscuribacterales bacterium]|nr:glycosyltransferase family 4 protein [Candidatus Obscuribacterales bacterium]
MNRRVVYVTPVFPSFTGSGLAMRAAAGLKLLSRWATIDLLVIPIYNDRIDAPPADVVNLCQSWKSVPNPDWSNFDPPSSDIIKIVGNEKNIPREWRWCSAEWRRRIKKAIHSFNPDLVFVFKFYLAPYVLPNIGGLPCWLDIDELESSYRARLARVYSLCDKKEQAREMELEAQGYAKLEAQYLGRFNKVFASSKREAEGILSRFKKATVRVLPNSYPKSLPYPQRTATGNARLLFVGSLGYFPNEDAVKYFNREILPLIKQRSRVPVELVVVGGGWKQAVEPAKLKTFYTDVKFVGEVEETTPFYAETDIVVVPLRSSGGTRIKILEAFSHSRAVVSTSIGAEGLELLDGVHLEIADRVEDFTEKVVNLIEDSQRRTELAKKGHELFKNQYLMKNLELQVPHYFAD